MSAVIIDMSFGCYSAYPATIENAKKILDNYLENMEPQAKEINDPNSEKKFINRQNVKQVIQDILKLDNTRMATKTIAASQENKQEIIMYCFNNQIDLRGSEFNEYQFFSKFNLKDFSFFANNENWDCDAELMDDYVMEQARKYRMIMNDKWNTKATDIAKIEHILDFAMELGHRDVKYAVCEVKEL
jgi:hypothetical protein